MNMQFLYRIAISLLIVVVLVPVATGAQETWRIEEFASDIVVEQSGVVTITETISVDFGNQEKHGIYREIPYIYQDNDGGKTYTTIDSIVATQNGVSVEVKTTYDGGYVRIRIGDSDRTITGAHTYTVFYRATGVLQQFGNVDELNWNVTGTEWGVPIDVASASVTVPAATIEQVSCYAGQKGANTPCTQAVITDDHTAIFSARALGPHEGLTAAVGFTPGAVPILAVAPPPSLGSALTTTGGMTAAALVIVVGLGHIVQRWYRHGRDRLWGRSALPGERSDRDGVDHPEAILPIGHDEPVSVEYKPPDDLRPAEIGVVMDERADTLDVSATIVHLAARGFLEITEIPKKWMFGSVDYSFTRTKKKAGDLLIYETTLLDRLFDNRTTVKMSDLKKSFYKDLKTVKEKLYEEVTNKKLFPSRPDQVRGRHAGVAIAVLVTGIASTIGSSIVIGNAAMLAFWHQLWAGASLGWAAVGLMLLVVSPFMSRKTGYGRELYQRSRGYEVFVSGTEKYRAKFLEEKGLFFDVLPYAIVFGVTDKLANAFEEMGVEPSVPGWYHGSGTFHPAIFAASMNNFSNSLGSAMASTPSSSGSGGGGFSGGGFGGGGGGAW